LTNNSGHHRQHVFHAVMQFLGENGLNSRGNIALASIGGRLFEQRS
jgi:hypothetical protein